VLPAPPLFLVALSLALGARDSTASAAPAPGAVKPRPAVYALLQIVKRPGVSTPEEYSRNASVFKDVLIVYPVMEDPKILALKVIKQQAKPHTWLMDHLRIEMFEDTGVFKLSLDGGTLQEQAIILKAVLQISFHEQEKTQKRFAKTIQGMKDLLPSDKAGIAEMERWLTQAELNRLPPQINLAQYVNDVLKSIESHKASLKKREKQIEEFEQSLRLMPHIRILEWPAPPV
jgi:hypothetical protein